MYSIKSEPPCKNEPCLTSCVSEHEMVSVKEENTSVVTAVAVEKTEREVNNDVYLCCLTHFIQLFLTVYL
jgi:hypothetical protein